MTPVDWSSSVVGVLSRTISPPGVTQMRSVKVPPTSTPTLYPTSGPFGSHLLTQRVRTDLVDLEREVFERSGEHHAVVAARTFDGHVFVDDVVEHRLRIAREGIAPTATAAVVVHDALAGVDRNPVRGVRDLVLVVTAVTDDHLVRRAVLAAADTRHRVLHADDVRVDL